MCSCATNSLLYNNSAEEGKEGGGETCRDVGIIGGGRSITRGSVRDENTLAGLALHTFGDSQHLTYATQTAAILVMSIIGSHITLQQQRSIHVSGAVLSHLFNPSWVVVDHQVATMGFDFH